MSLSFHAELAASKCTRCLDEFGFVWGAQSKFTEWTKLSYTISTLCTIWCLVMGDLRSVYITALQWYNILWCKDQSKRLNEHCTSVHVEVCQLPSHTITTRIWAVFTSTDHLTTYCFYLSEQYCFFIKFTGFTVSCSALSTNIWRTSCEHVENCKLPLHSQYILSQRRWWTFKHPDSRPAASELKSAEVFGGEWVLGQMPAKEGFCIKGGRYKRRSWEFFAGCIFSGLKNFAASGMVSHPIIPNMDLPLYGSDRFESKSSYVGGNGVLGNGRN